MTLYRQACAPCPPPKPAAAFTLVELVLSFSLMVIVVGCAYACLSAGFAAQKTLEPRTDAVQSARVALALMTADLRGACLLPGGLDFIGVRRNLGEMRADSIDFATHHHDPKRPGEGDFCELSYFLDRHPQTGQLCLWRRRNPMIGVDPLKGGTREEIASGVKGLLLEYYDGLDWYDTWGDLNGRGKSGSSSSAYNLSGLPEAVRITLLIDPELARPSSNARPASPEQAPPPLPFRTVVRLNLAASVLEASSSGTTSTGATGPSSTTPGPVPTPPQ